MKLVLQHVQTTPHHIDVVKDGALRPMVAGGTVSFTFIGGWLGEHMPEALDCAEAAKSVEEELLRWFGPRMEVKE